MQRSQATSAGIRLVAEALNDKGGVDAAGLRVAEKYLEAFRELAKSSTTMLLPSATSDPAAMIAQAMSIFKTVGSGTTLPTDSCRSKKESDNQHQSNQAATSQFRTEKQGHRPLEEVTSSQPVVKFSLQTPAKSETV